MKINDCGYEPDVTAAVQDLISALDRDKHEFELAVARFTVKLVQDIQQGRCEPLWADDVYTLMDIFIGDAYPEYVMSEHVSKIIFEGMTLHHYGDEFGADLELMTRLADELLNNNTDG